MGGQIRIGEHQQAIRSGTRLGAHEQMYSCGEWVDLAYDPVPDAGTGDFAEDLRAAGFYPWLAADGFADQVDSRYCHDLHVPLSLVVYERYDRVPRFAVKLTGNTDGTLLTTYAASLPDLMDLLAKWTPTIKMLAQIDRVAKKQREAADAAPPSAGSLPLPPSSLTTSLVRPTGPHST